MSAPVLVVGAGSWGTALAIQLARQCPRVWLWGRDSKQRASLEKERCNSRYLPDIPLPEPIRILSCLRDLPSEVKDAVLAVPCQALPEVCKALRPLHLRYLCISCKGFQATDCNRTATTATLENMLNHRLVRTLLKPEGVAVLSGPSFAHEVARGLPTALTLAADTASAAKYLVRYLHSEYFRIYPHDDLPGVQVGGAVKNIMAIASGVSDGLHYGANARAALVTRGAKEMRQLGHAFGARAETFTGLSGIGDLMLSCNDDQSRNRRFGLALARGLDPKAAQAHIAQTVEGVQTAIVIHQIAQACGLDLPITAQVARLAQGQCSPQDSVQALLSRHPKNEDNTVGQHERWAET